MEKREAAVYLYLGILVLGAILAIYFFNLQLTGFAILQNNQTAFDEGTPVNIFYDENLSALVLDENQTSGTYTSKIFGNGSETQWDSVTWEGNVPANTSFSLSISDCEFENCSDAEFVSLENISNESSSGTFPYSLNLTKPYLQYILTFDRNNKTDQSPQITSISIDYSPVTSSESVVTSVSLSEPTGTKPSGTETPLNFTFVGENVTCWYNIVDADDENKALITAGNITLDNCNNISDLGVSHGNFILYIYVNGSTGFASADSAFSITNPNKPKSTAAKEEDDTDFETPIITRVTALTLQNIETSTMNPLESQNLNLIVSNTGDISVSSCVLSAGGDFASWLSLPADSQNINIGEEKTFAFSISVPENTTDGNYVFPLSLTCTQILKDSSFSVNVEKKKIEFNITEVERTRKDRVVVTYSLEELLDEEQIAELQFFLYDAGNQEVGNASVNQTLSAGEKDEFRTNVPINASLEGNMTLSASLNSEQYSVSVKKPISIGAPTGFFVFGDDMGTTGNVLAIMILIIGGVAIYFFLKRKKISKKLE